MKKEERSGISERLVELRKSMKLTQEEFAIKINVSRNMVQQTETGYRNYSSHTVSDICRRCDISEEWLVNGTGSMKDRYTDPYAEAAAEIAMGDPKMKKLILLYWKLPDNKKKLFWDFLETFCGFTEDDDE